MLVLLLQYGSELAFPHVGSRVVSLSLVFDVGANPSIPSKTKE
jgi:hypothetical protein